MRYEDVSEYVAKLVGKGDDVQVWVGKRSVELREHGVYAIDPT